MRYLDSSGVCGLVARLGLEDFIDQLMRYLEEDLGRWECFHKSPRHAVSYRQGVIELMPWADDRLYSFKYVNGHPGNVAQGQPSVVAFGALAETRTGVPLLLAEMTLLTAIRTAAVAAVAARRMACTDSKVLGLLGTGAQSEFQTMALGRVLPIKEVRYLDTDPDAMRKYARNMESRDLTLVPCDAVSEVLNSADVLVTATAARRKVQLFRADQVRPGTHIQALGGDSPGKTELDPALLRQARVVVEYLPQSLHEGEVQNADAGVVDAELWELVSGRRSGRQDDTEITLFDAVGFALEDFSTLRLVHDLCEQTGLEERRHFMARPKDPKDLYGMLLG